MVDDTEYAKRFIHKCPFCDSEKVDCIRTYRQVEKRITNSNGIGWKKEVTAIKGYHIKCMSCLATGPEHSRILDLDYDTRTQKVINEWNTVVGQLHQKNNCNS